MKNTRQQILRYWFAIGSSVLRKPRALVESSFKMYFKLAPSLVDVLYRRISSRFFIRERDLLWTLFFLKSHDPVHGKIAFSLGTKLKTMHEIVKKSLDKILSVAPKVAESFMSLLLFEISVHDNFRLIE